MTRLRAEARCPELIALALLWLALSSAAVRAAELPDIIDLVRPSIVGFGTVVPTRRPPGRFVGTAFVVGDGRHVLTNAHNLPAKLDTERREYLALLVGDAAGAGGEDVLRAVLVAVDREHDVALLRFDGEPRPALRLAAEQRVREGELYAFTGFPIGMVIGMRPVTHRGIIAAITPIAVPQPSARGLSTATIRLLRDPYNVYQLDATAYPGNSGSPLYDPTTGGVIGIINKVFVKQSKEAVLTEPSGITYAVPVRHALRLLREAKLSAP